MTLLQSVRDRYHPLFHLRRLAAFRAVTRLSVTVSTKDRDSGQRIYLDMFRNAALWASGMALGEEAERASFATVVKQIGARRFWDVGANVGLYSLLFCRLVPDGEALAFEPDARNRQLLGRTIRRNRLAITVRPDAVSDTCGEAAFVLDAVSGATGSLVPGEDGTYFAERHHATKAASVSVRTITLDSLTEPVPDFIKIDVEGAELMVLRGAKKLLAKHRPAIMLETSVDADKVTKLLTALGYRLYDMRTLAPVGRAVHNTLALHPERHGDIAT